MLLSANTQRKIAHLLLTVFVNFVKPIAGFLYEMRQSNSKNMWPLSIHEIYSPSKSFCFGEALLIH